VRSLRRHSRNLALAGVASIASIVACGGGPDPGDDAATGRDAADAVVRRVVDGDTVDVDVDGRTERVRLTGIDTPEIEHPPSDGRPGNRAECFADEAHAFTASLIPVGTPVRLERDVVGRDDYGRLLAYVYRADDGIFVNYEIVRHGFARPLTIPPNETFRDLMVRAARDAEADHVGLWAACGAS
jgi:micrococcal nuclease